MTYSFDSVCYELAEHFYPGAPKPLLDELAQRFQDQVEGAASSELDAWQEADTQRRCADDNRCGRCGGTPSTCTCLPPASNE